MSAQFKGSGESWHDYCSLMTFPKRRIVRNSEMRKVAFGRRHRYTSVVRSVVIMTVGWHTLSVGGVGLNGNVAAESIVDRDSSETLPFPSSPLEFQATAYCQHGTTKSGVPAAAGLIAADPAILPLGSLIHVDAPMHGGVYRVMDTGRLVKGKVIDIYLPKLRTASKFGRQRVLVTVLQYGKFRDRLRNPQTHRR